MISVGIIQEDMPAQNIMVDLETQKVTFIDFGDALTKEEYRAACAFKAKSYSCGTLNRTACGHLRAQVANCPFPVANMMHMVFETNRDLFPFVKRLIPGVLEKHAAEVKK